MFSPANIVFEPCGIFIFDNFFEILKVPNLEKRCEINSVLTIVDSVNFNSSKAKYGSFIYNQIKNAGKILLSKLERTTQSVDELICDIKNINPDAFIMSKIWKDFDVTDFEFLLSQQKQLTDVHNAHHHNALRSVTIKLENIFTQEKINALITHCKSGAFGDLCRVKGVLKTEEHLALLNIAMQDAVVEKFKGISEPSLTFMGQTVHEDEISKFVCEQ